MRFRDADRKVVARLWAIAAALDWQTRLQGDPLKASLASGNGLPNIGRLGAPL